MGLFWAGVVTVLALLLFVFVLYFLLFPFHKRNKETRGRVLEEKKEKKKVLEDLKFWVDNSGRHGSSYINCYLESFFPPGLSFYVGIFYLDAAGELQAVSLNSFKNIASARVIPDDFSILIKVKFYKNLPCGGTEEKFSPVNVISPIPARVLSSGIILVMTGVGSPSLSGSKMLAGLSFSQPINKAITRAANIKR